MGGRFEKYIALSEKNHLKKDHFRAKKRVLKIRLNWSAHVHLKTNNAYYHPRPSKKKAHTHTIFLLALDKFLGALKNIIRNGP